MNVPTSCSFNESQQQPLRCSSLLVDDKNNNKKYNNKKLTQTHQQDLANDRNHNDDNGHAYNEKNNEQKLPLNLHSQSFNCLS